MFPSTSISEEASVSSETRSPHDFTNLVTTSSPHPKPKKKRTQPGNPDPEAEVVALSPKSLMVTNRFVCEICNKGFQRDQNLQLHRRGHNLPWRLRQRTGNEVARKRVYVCPEPSCVHHQPSRALGDLTGIKKHFCRKHGEKKWKCDKCFKNYAVYSDWKAHSKTCGTREYKCDCGTLFSRKDSFITHRAFCDALAEESARLTMAQHPSFSPTWDPSFYSNPNHVSNIYPYLIPTSFNENEAPLHPPPNPYLFSHSAAAAAAGGGPHLSATWLLQKPDNVEHLRQIAGADFHVGRSVDLPTRNFLGVDSSGTAGQEEPLTMHGLGQLDLVTASSGGNDGRGGEHTDPLVGFGFPPAAGAWGGL